MRHYRHIVYLLCITVYCGLVCVCYSLVSETTSVFPSKQCSCRGLWTILGRHWYFPTRNGWKLGGNVFFFCFFVKLDCGVLCWPTRESTEQMERLSRSILNSKLLSYSHCLVGIRMAETCWFNLSFLSPGEGCFVYSKSNVDHMMLHLCIGFLLSLIKLPWSIFSIYIRYE